MIINISRVLSAHDCWRKTFNTYHRRASGKKSMSLTDGSALHNGVAAGLANKDWHHALKVAREQFDKDVLESDITQEDQFLIQDHWDLCESMINLYRDNYHVEEYTVLQPECEFCVDFPGSEHNCIFLHWENSKKYSEFGGFESIWRPPTAEEILSNSVLPAHDGIDIECPCYVTHKLKGKTDALVSWHNSVWLLEHKTSSLMGPQFWNWFDLSPQVTGYLWGIKQATGIQPRGVVVNGVFKPSGAQVSNWNNKRKNGPPKEARDYLKFERQPFLRNEEELEQFAKRTVTLANEWETRITTNDFPAELNAQNCISYNRKCDYFNHCKYELEDFSEFEIRPPDYVDEMTNKLVEIQAMDVVGE